MGIFLLTSVGTERLSKTERVFVHSPLSCVQNLSAFHGCFRYAKNAGLGTCISLVSFALNEFYVV